MNTEELVKNVLDPCIDQVNYRGLSFSVYKDLTGLMFYTIVSGKRCDICTLDESYRHKLMDIIDENLNLVAEVDGRAKLIKFQNGSFEDIKLVCDNRILKVYLVED